jgi:hypothetical protein
MKTILFTLLGFIVYVAAGSAIINFCITPLVLLGGLLGVVQFYIFAVIFIEDKDITDLNGFQDVLFLACAFITLIEIAFLCLLILDPIIEFLKTIDWTENLFCF